MLKKLSTYFFLLAGILILSQHMQCTSEKDVADTGFRNLAPGVKYVGKETCGSCHVENHQGFLQTGMGQSIDTVSWHKSAAKAALEGNLYDTVLDLHYQAEWRGEELWLQEYRMREGDTLHDRWVRASFIIGSGQHTNSHLWMHNGYVHQMPFTYYTQEGRLDFPPGFEGGKNTRFSRPIGLECMSCHNAKPDLVLGSTNKFEHVPQGIDCERCHGPGEIHVKEKLAGIFVDTATQTDYSIVNPRKLPFDLQFEICQRCHLQGNAVLKEGKSFQDFKPGMYLKEVMDVYTPRYSDSDVNFIMASHVDRLKSSACFLESKQNLNCFTCHNPHVSVLKTERAVFNKKCGSCHQQDKCTELESLRLEKNDDCVSCHMPKSGSIDIPHVSVTDHKIGIHKEKEDIQAKREFVQLVAVNNPRTSNRSRALAFLQQYERFEPDVQFLDSAYVYWQNMNQQQEAFLHVGVLYHYLREEHKQLRTLLHAYADEELSNWLNQVTYDNEDSWTAYRIAQSLDALEDDQALKYYQLASKLAPFQLDFRNKLAVSYLRQNQISEAEAELNFILKEFPYHVEALNNRAYLNSMRGNIAQAEKDYLKAIELDPDYLRARFALVGLYINEGKSKLALKQLDDLVYLQPDNQQVIQAYHSLKEEINE